MKIQEIIKAFDVSEKTVHNWKNSNTGRKFLYEVLKRLPDDFIKDVKQQIEEEKLKESLKDIKDK